MLTKLRKSRSLTVHELLFMNFLLKNRPETRVYYESFPQTTSLCYVYQFLQRDRYLGFGVLIFTNRLIKWLPYMKEFERYATVKG